jgi:hypothetical protein
LHACFSGHLLAFRGRKANLIKIVFWDGTDLCLFTKRLEQGRFPWPGADQPGNAVALTSGSGQSRRPPSISTPRLRGERPTCHLEDFQGVLQVDGRSPSSGRPEAGPGGRVRDACREGDIVLAACWAHARRKLHNFHQATGSPIAAEPLRRVAELYAIEMRIRGQPTEVRRRARQEITIYS